MGNSNNVKPKKMTSLSFKPPQPLTSQNEFFETWLSWKEEFLMFKTVINEDSNNKNRWGNMMLNLMGPIGRDIYSTFVFNSPGERDNVDILLKKFDSYYIFSAAKRKPRENAYEYINDLQVMTKEKGIKNEEDVIKEKILTEIDGYQFINAARNFLPTFLLLTDFNKLTLREIAFIWEMYSENSLAKNCRKCGNDHDVDSCPALGKYCSRCNKYNHFRRRCPLIFVDNCNYCGGCHFSKKCPAYNEICTKCQKQNHFSWKCQHNQILRCRYCDLNHPASKACCPARNNICTTCHNVGHIPSKCNTRSHSRSH